MVGTISDPSGHLPQSPGRWWRWKVRVHYGASRQRQGVLQPLARRRAKVKQSPTPTNVVQKEHAQLPGLHRATPPPSLTLCSGSTVFSLGSYRPTRMASLHTHSHRLLQEPPLTSAWRRSWASALKKCQSPHRAPSGSVTSLWSGPRE